ncbi:MFS transporter [Vibrio cholerae]|uniref:MFS transporter n=1 Tax=Vibrio cholerae TaxID=666 RepID=UPI000BA9466F|nr:MFS transporter [Vibrio cholerae]EGR2117656.1 MFS transporter [Vibrio cholerae]EJL6848178.1 MFS transporter [Vibrio cholerae]PAS35960.1 MFS transporter [Vibrio cholerae]QKU84155.1 MFS transporter [Vibrio cholerae]
MSFQTAKHSTLSKASLLSLLAGVYTTQSLIGMFTLQGLPAVLRSEGVSTSQIGLFYLAMLPWALKFLWAPYVESIRQQGITLTRHAYLIGLAQTGMLLVLGAFSFNAVISDQTLLFVGVLTLALLSTFADITTDGLAVDVLPADQRRFGNVMQVGGAYLGAVFGGGLFIYLTASVSWQNAILLLMALLLFMSLPTARLFGKSKTSQPLHPTHRPSLKSALTNPKVTLGLGLVALCQLGTRGVQSMMMPFLYDHGVELEALGLLVAGGGIITAFIGIGLSGWLMKKVSAISMVLVCLALEALLYAGFTFYSYSAQITPLTYGLEGLYVLNTVLVAAKFVALYTLMMDWSYGDQAGVDFSLFQSMDMLIAMLMAMLCGWIIAQFGYQVHYLLTFSVTLCALLTLYQFHAYQLRLGNKDICHVSS